MNEKLDNKNNYIKQSILEDYFADLEEDVLFAVGFEECIIGYVTQFNNVTVLYDYYKCIDVLVERDGMDYDEAIEFFEFNVTGSWLGEKTPSFAVLKKDF